MEDDVIMEPQIGVVEGMEIEPFNDEKDPNLTQNDVKGELDLVVSEGETNMEPYEGMEFESEEAARAFYSAYARHVGFRIRISRYTRSRRDNSIISRLIVCSKEGFRESRGNDGLFGERKQQRQRAVTRVGCKAMMMVKKLAPGKWVVSKYVKEHNHGPVPPRKVEVRVVQKEEELVEKSNISSDGGAIHEPFDGMEFDSEEDARSFYVNYARQMGFRARISKYCRSRRDNSIISRQIVCSKEGFREVRIKKEEMDDGRVKRPRVITRIGCKAMIIVKKLNTGKWVVSRFEKEHNHALITSKKVPRLLQSSNDGIEKGLVTYLGETNVLPNAGVVMGSGCCGGGQGTSRESLTVLYNQLCYEAIKYAQEGAVSEDIYNVAMSALKEAVEKVAAAKRSTATVAQGINANHGSNITQCSHAATKAVTGKELVLMQQPIKFVLIPSTSLANDLKQDNHPVEAPLILNIPNGQGMKNPNAVSGLKQSSPTVGNGVHDGAVQNSQKLDQIVSQAKATPGSCSSLISTGVPEAQMVAIPALPVTLYMPMIGSLAETSSGTSGSNAYALVAAPVESLPVPTAALPNAVHWQSAATLEQCPQPYTGPNPQVHATAIAAGARVVPPQEAASLIKAIKARVRSAKSAVASGCRQLSATEGWSPRPYTSLEDGHKALVASQAHGEGTDGQEAVSSGEVRLHRPAEGNGEIEVGMMDHSAVYDSASEDHHLFSDGGS